MMTKTLLLAVIISTASAFSVTTTIYESSGCSGTSVSSTQAVGTCYSNADGTSTKLTSSSSSCSSGNSVTYTSYSDTTCTTSESEDTVTIGQCFSAGGISIEFSCSDCFPANATVEMENGATKRMDQLAVGDRVRTSATTFSDVMFFSHDDAETTSSFYNLQTASGHSLVLSAKHYVHVLPNYELVQARNVRVGQVVELADGTSSAIVSITNERHNGLYNPHTLDGKIVVNGVLASCYTGSIEPTVAHALLWPLRALYNVGIRVFDSAPASPALRAAVLNLLPEGK
jgi:hypothetical protein